MTPEQQAVYNAVLKELENKGVHYVSVKGESQDNKSNYKNDGAKGKGAVAIGENALAAKGGTVSIGRNAHIEGNGGNTSGEGSVAIGDNSLITTNGLDLASIAIGKNAKVLNGSGKQERVLSFMPDNYTNGDLPDNADKSAGGIAIGTNSYARTGSIQLGHHTFAGYKMGGIDVTKANEEANIVGMTTVGTNTYNKGALANMYGAYSIITGSFTGAGGFNSLSYGSQNFGANVVGSLNSIRSKGHSGSSGIANSIVGVANTVENANGTLVYGAGNKVTNSIASIGAPSTFLGSPTWDKMVESLQKGIKDSKSGGAVLAIGGGNVADYVRHSQLVGVNNTVTGTENKVSEFNMVNGYQNTATNITHVTMIGSENQVTDTKNALVFGDKRKLTKANGSVVIGVSDTVKEIKVEDVTVIGHNALAEGANAVAIGRGASADSLSTVAIGDEARVSSDTNLSGGVAIGKKSNVINGNGRQEKYLGFGTLNDPQRSATGVAIGAYSFARTGSIQIGAHTYLGKMGGIEVTDGTNGEANHINQTTVGTNTFNKGIFGTMIGAYSISTGSFTAKGGMNSLRYGSQNFGSTVVGSLNTIQSKGHTGSAGISNSIVGLANVTENTNGTLIFGAGNKVTNSIKSISGVPNGVTSGAATPDELIEKLRQGTIDSESGGSTMVIGGGNTADYTRASQIMGVNNTLTGTKDKESTYNLVDGFKNKAENVTHVTMIGSDNKVQDTTGAVLLGDKRKLTGADGSIVLGSADESAETNVKDATVIGHNANTTVAGGVALGSGSVANRGKADAAAVYLNDKKGVKETVKGDLAAVSVGNANATRQITGVAAGTEDTDAVNVAQLKALNTKVDNGTVHYFSVKADDSKKPADTNWNNDGATGDKAIAIGQKAKSQGYGAVAMGTSAHTGANAHYGLALGMKSDSAGFANIAIGNEAKAQAAMYATAIGQESVVTKDQGIAIGTNAQTEAENGISFGTQAKSLANRGIAVGTNSTVDKTGGRGIAIGDGAYVGAKTQERPGTGMPNPGDAWNPSEPYLPVADDTVAGPKKLARENSMAIGMKASAFGFQTTALGAAAEAHDTNTTAVGAAAVAKGNYSTALGKQARTFDKESTSVGHWADSRAEFATALGSNTIVYKKGGVALGFGARAYDENSVAIGSNSFAKEAIDGKAYLSEEEVKAAAGIVSVGNPAYKAGDKDFAANYRRIVNVAGGINDNDAVNVAQLKVVNAKADKNAEAITNLTNTVNANGKATIVKVDGEENKTDGNLKIKKTEEDGQLTYDLSLNDEISLGKAGTPGKDGVDGKIGLNGKDGTTGEIRIGQGKAGVDGKDGETTTRIIYKDKDQKDHTVATLDDGLKFKGDNDTVVTRKLNEQLNITGGITDAKELSDNNIGVVGTQDGGMAVKLSKKLKGLTSAEFKDGDNVTNITAGDVTVTKKEGNETKTVSIWDLNKNVNENTQNIKDAKVTVEGDNETGVKVENTAEAGKPVNYKVSLDDKVKVGNVTIDGKDSKGEITGLTNTTIDGTDFAKKGRAATEEQLKQAMAKTQEASRTTVKAGDNITVTPAVTGASEYTVALAKDISVDSVTANEYKVGDKTYINDKGINANENKITNVADGVVSKDSKDAVNGGQLFGVEQKVNQNISILGGKVSELDGRVDRVGAGAAALAALHPLDFDPDDKWDFAAGYGNYKGANAAAIGAYYRPNEDTMFSVGGSFGGGENMVNAGVSVKLGQGNHVSTSKVAMAKDMLAMQKRMAEMEAQMAKMQGFIGALTGVDTQTAMFPDVPENHWAYEYVKGLCEQGIIEGYPDGTFGGNRSMTRYEFAAMLYRALAKGVSLDARAVKEFAPELGRIRVDVISQNKEGQPVIERVRVNEEKKEK